MAAELRNAAVEKRINGRSRVQTANRIKEKEKALDYLQEFPSIITQAKSNLNMLNQYTVDSMDFSLER